MVNQCWQTISHVIAFHPYFSDTLDFKSIDEVNDFTSMLTISMDIGKIGAKQNSIPKNKSNRTIPGILPWFEEKLTSLLNNLNLKNVHELMKHIAVE